MPVAFVCAMPFELAPLRKRLQLVKTRTASLDVHRGTAGGQPVVAIATGMGPALATAKLNLLLDSVEVDRVVIVGITGAVDDETPIGTLVRPAVVVNGTTGEEYVPHPFGDGHHQGKMWTTDRLITDLEVIARLRSDGVVGLDMETAATAEVCESRGIPWSVFRTISDRATDGTIDDEVFGMSNMDGTPNPRAIASYVLRHPGRLPAMARMARDAKLATSRAAEAAIAAVSSG